MLFGFSVPPVCACTGFGAVEKSGTIIGKNRDYFYVPQSFGLMKPIPQFHDWYKNKYHHDNSFYAVTSAESISMGVNQGGLTAIEEDVLSTVHFKDAAEYKKHQQKSGTPDGMVLYGVLQNFNNIDEMMPSMRAIFSNAAPDFYEFADSKKLLIVEVAPSKNNTNSHPYIYRIVNRPGNYFVHTNTYTALQFEALNKAFTNPVSLQSSDNRYQRMSYWIANAKPVDIQSASKWFLDTYSEASGKDDSNQCMNTSLFRSNLQGHQSIRLRPDNNKIFGTVASMIVSNHGNFKRSHLYLMMLDSITTQKDGSQLIKYKTLYTTLEKLFQSSKQKFIMREFVRKPPVDGVCK